MKKLFLAFMAMILIIGCSKDHTLLETSEDYEGKFSQGVQLGARSVSSKMNYKLDNINTKSIKAMVALTRNYYLIHQNVNPNLVFDGLNLNRFEVEIENQKLLIEKIGLISYLDNLESKYGFNEQVSGLLKGGYSMILKINYNETTISDIANEFAQVYEKPCFDDPYYCYVYNVVHNLFLDYQNQEIIFRDGCDFPSFFASVVAGIGTGSTIGGLFPGEGFFDLKFKALGGIVGGVVGAIVGIFTFISDCDDCGPVTGIYIQSDDNCDLSRTLAAFGGGEDAGGYQWTVVQNGNTVSFTTISNLLGITQTSAQDPITVSVRTVCEDSDDGGNPFTKVFDLNIMDISNPLGQAGDIAFSHVCPTDGNTGGPSYVGCHSGGEDHAFFFISSNQTSGNIIYEYEISPSTYLVNELSNNNIEVIFNSLGNYLITFRAINNCTNDVSEESFNLQILN